MDHVSDVLEELLDDLMANRDSEIAAASEVGGQYMIDHHDLAAWDNIDRDVDRLARSWDSMIRHVGRWLDRARRIEGRCDNFYGD